MAPLDKFINNNLAMSDLTPGCWTELEASIQQSLRQSSESRLRLAQDLADQEYHYPECEAVAAKVEQRSFCFHHGAVTKQSVLLVHGFTACPYEMRELGEALYQRGLNVYGVRLAGHGTRVSDFARYNRDDWQASAAKGLTIASLLGEQVSLVGESMGGTLAALLAKNFPHLVRRLILCAPCFRIANPMAWTTKLRIIRRFLPENDMGVQFDWQHDYWYQKIPTSQIAELVRLADAGRKVGPALIVPTLIIQADNDRIVNPNGARRFFNTLKQLEPSAKKLVFLKDGHHNLTTDLNPNKNKVFQLVSDFIASRLAKDRWYFFQHFSGLKMLD